MIVRLWTFPVRAQDAARFEEFERREGIPMMQGQKGCLGVEMFRRLSEDKYVLEYNLLSRWEDWEQLQTALASTAWKEEVELFVSQGFGEGNGVITHFEAV
jgi:heme-degrading monooxygenase HmoA